MSSKKVKKGKDIEFSQVWLRIIESTQIKTYKDLAGIIGISPSAVTKKSTEGYFPVDWAYWVAEEYNLNVYWLLKGIGDKTGEKKEFLCEVQKWLDNLALHNQGYYQWFKIEFGRCFPEFDEWRRKKGIKLTTK